MPARNKFSLIRDQRQPDSQGLHLHYPPAKPTTAKTLTQAGQVAPRFSVPRGAAKRGRGGKGFFVYKRVNYNELSAKGAYSAFRVETVRTQTFSMATPKKLYSVESGIDLSSCRICGSVVDQHYCKNLFSNAGRELLDMVKKFTARS